MLSMNSLIHFEQTEYWNVLIKTVLPIEVFETPVILGTLFIIRYSFILEIIVYCLLLLIKYCKLFIIINLRNTYKSQLLKTHLGCIHLSSIH